RRERHAEVAGGDDDAAVEHRAALADQAIRDPAAGQRRHVDHRGVEAVNRAGDRGVEREAAGGGRRGHEQDGQRAHAVIAEALAHLGEEERGEAARMTEERRVVGARVDRTNCHDGRKNTMFGGSMRSALLISTYEMGRQPFGVASAAAWLRADGWDVRSIDAAKEKIAAGRLAAADLVGFHLPMHTATRLAGPVIAAARRANPEARIAAFGLYAPLNEAWLRSLGVDAVFGGEFEQDLASWAAVGTPRAQRPQGSAVALDKKYSADSASTAGSALPRVPRIHFLVPDRSTLPPLTKYATLQMPDGARRTVGYTEASRGCRHLCRHCPVVPIYEGQFRVVQTDVVLADVAAQVAAGASHITFGDPDFFNGPTHAMRIVRALHAAHPSISYDVTIKIEHLLKHRDLLPELATGCAFVTSAVESIDDRVLA